MNAVEINTIMVDKFNNLNNGVKKVLNHAKDMNQETQCVITSHKEITEGLIQMMILKKNQLEKDFPDIRNRIKRNEATPEEVQGWLKRSGEFKDIRRQIHDAEEAMDDVDATEAENLPQIRGPLESHDAKHKATSVRRKQRIYT